MQTNNRNVRRLTAGLLLITLVSLAAQQSRVHSQSKPFELTVDSIMRGPRRVGYPPSAVYWSQDNQRIYFCWKRPDEPRLKKMSLYAVNRDGSGLRRLTDEEAKQAPPATGELSKDKTMTVYADEGDIFIYDHAKQARRQITRTVDAETNPHFTFDQKRIYFTRQNNLYVMSLDGGSLEQLTDIRAGGAPGSTAVAGASPQRGTDSQEALKKEERALLEAGRERAEQRAEQDKRRKEREKRKPFNVPGGQNVVSLNLSPDGKYVIAAVNEPATGSKNTIVPNYVTESGYTEDIPGRSKVGDTQNRSRLVIINTENGETKNVDHGQRLPAAAPPQRTEMNATEQQRVTTGSGTERVDNQRSQPAAPKDRDVQLTQLQWSDDGRNAVLMGRAADNKDRWVMLLDPANGKTKVLATVHDDAWVDGPGAFTLGWLPDNSHRSE